MEPINVGVIGYGMMGKHHAKAWSEIPGGRVIGIAEKIEERRREAAQLHLSKIYTSGERMIESPIHLDVVVVTSHAPNHYRDVMLALGKGCHVVCEKPMATSLADCDVMVEAAKRKGVVLAIHHQSIFSRAFREAKRQIESGEIGRLELLRAYGKGRLACSDLMEIAGHLAHGICYLAGFDPVKVYGDVLVNGRRARVNDRIFIKDLYPEGRDSGYGAGDRILGFYTFQNGVRAELQLTTLENAPKTFGEDRNFGYYIDVFGSKKRLQLYLPRVLFVNDSPLDDRAKNNTPWTEPHPEFREDKDPVLFLLFAEDFVSAIREKRDPVVSGKDGRMAMEMTLGLYTSHFVGRPLRIPLENRNHPFAQ